MAKDYKTKRDKVKIDKKGVTKIADDPVTDQRVLAMVCSADGKSAITFSSGEEFYLIDGVPLVLPYNEEGWFVVPGGEDFTVDVENNILLTITLVWLED